MYDTSFKAVYHDKANKGLLINLINQTLPDEVEKVKDITEYLDRELSNDIAIGIDSRLDLICETDSGSRVIVEVQRQKFSSFMDRCLFYMSDVYYRQLSIGDDYNQLRPVYLIAILDYAYPHPDEHLWDSDNFISRYGFTELRTGELGTRNFFIIFAEAKRFTKSIEECRSERDFIFYWFLHGWKFDKETTPKQFEAMPRMMELIKASEVASFSAEKKLKYDREIMTELDRINYEREQQQKDRAAGFAEGLAEGREEGREEGISEGEHNKAVETARKMKADGLSIELILKYTGLNEATVMQL